MNLLLPLTTLLGIISIAMVLSLREKKKLYVSYLLNIIGSVAFTVIISLATELVVDDIVAISSTKIRYLIFLGCVNILGILINGYKNAHLVRVSLLSSLILIAGVIIIGAKGLVSFYIAYTIIYTISSIAPRVGNKDAWMTRYYLAEVYVATILLAGVALYLGATNSLWLEASPVHKHLHVISYICFFIVLCFRLGIVPFHLLKGRSFCVGGGKVIGVNLVGQLLNVVALIALVAEVGSKVDESFRARIIVIVAVMAVLSAMYGQVKGLFQYRMRSILGSNLAAQASYALIFLFLFEGVARERAVMLFLVQLYISFAGLQIFLNKVASDENKLSGLFYRDKALALFISVLMMNLAGIPFTAGFTSRYQILNELGNNGYWFIFGAFVLSFVLGFIYLFREVIGIYSKQKIDSHYQNYIALSGIEKVTIAFFCVFVIIAGVVPKIFL